MSRSFVRAWATVATIMAMVCLAFVQPMPEHVSPAGAKAVQAAGLAAGGQEDGISSTPPFVDTMTTGKTFTPYVTLPGWQLTADLGSRRAESVAATAPLRSSPLEPPARPG